MLVAQLKTGYYVHACKHSERNRRLKTNKRVPSSILGHFEVMKKVVNRVSDGGTVRSCDRPEAVGLIRAGVNKLADRLALDRRNLQHVDNVVASFLETGPLDQGHLADFAENVLGCSFQGEFLQRRDDNETRLTGGKSLHRTSLGRLLRWGWTRLVCLGWINRRLLRWGWARLVCLPYILLAMDQGSMSTLLGIWERLAPKGGSASATMIANVVVPASVPTFGQLAKKDSSAKKRDESHFRLFVFSHEQSRSSTNGTWSLLENLEHTKPFSLSDEVAHIWTSTEMM